MTNPLKPPAEDKGDEEVKEEPHLLVALVQQATTTKKEGTSSRGSSNIVVYLLVLGAVVIGFSIMGWLLVRAKRRAAELAYELRKKEEEQKRVAEDHKLAKNNAARDAVHKQVHQLEGQIQELKEKLGVQRELAATRAKAVADATSWEDLGL